MSEQRPEFLTEDHLSFLDALREVGSTNMFGAARYLKLEFPELTTDQSSEILLYWMATYSQRRGE